MTTRRTIHLTEWEHQKPEGDGALSGVFLQSAADRALASRLRKDHVLTLRELRRGLEIETRSYVGKIRFDAFDLIITPKLGYEPFARLFRYAYGLRDLRLLTTPTYSAGGSLFEDLLPKQLLAEAQELVSRGLHRSYITIEEPLSSPRGRIDMQRLVREMGVPKGSLPCRYSIRSEDSLLNQTLLGGLKLAAGITKTPPLKMALRRLAQTLLPTIKELPLRHGLIRRAEQSLHRMNAAYAPALTIIRLLLEGEAPTLREEASESFKLPGFLFDMNRFFQSLLGRFLRENLPRGELIEEHALRGLLRYAVGQNPRRRKAPQPRPDFAVQTAEGKLLILDAKYRDLWRRSLPREMLYQLSMYALSQPRGACATILYPTTVDEALPARIEIREPLGEWDRASILLRPVHLEKLDQAIEGGPACAEKRQCLAESLVFS